MTEKKQVKRVSTGLIVVLCLLMVVGTVAFTGYQLYKTKYDGPYVGYSNEMIKELPASGLERTLANLFVSDEKIAQIQSDTRIIPTQSGSDPVDEDGVEIHYLNGSTYEAFMMIVHNPEDLVLAVNPQMDSGGAGPSIEEYIALYDGIGGINAGGFEDTGGNGNGGQAWGIVISDGKIISGSPSDFTDVIGITYDNKLVCQTMSAQQALDWNVRDAITFGPIFISQFEVVFTTGRHPMLNPRTVLGQREDGAFLLLVIDGRQPLSFGSTYYDIIDIMQEYGAMTAGNLDGGNSSVMVYNGSTVNSTVSLYGARNLPTAFVIKKGGN